MNNCSELAGVPDWVKVAVPIVYMAIETWLGKTSKTKSGSVPELVINILKSIFKGNKNGK